MSAETSLDEELVEGLRGAKKAPRNFALIAKGNKPVKLIVQKKPILSGEINKAKTEFKGNDVISGVVEGSGADLIFFVQNELPSIKTTALKEFIGEQTELTVKPRFELATTLPKVETEDTPGGAAPAASGTSTAAVGESESNESESNESTDSSADLKKKLTAQLREIVPAVQQAIVAAPARKGDLLAAVAAMKQALETDLAEAQAAYAALVVMLDDKPTQPVSIMKLGKARVEWEQIRDRAATDISSLKPILQAEFGDDAEQSGSLANALKKLDSIVAAVKNDLHEQLDKILNADSATRPALVSKAKGTIAGLTTLIDKDPVMIEIDDNEFVPGMSVVAPIRAKLQEISAALG